MKKILNIGLMAALVCGMSLSVSSCKDDDDNNNNSSKTSTVTVDNDLLTHGIETEMKSDAVDVKVNSDGMWTATLGKDADWVMIKDWEVTYEGSQTLTLLFDENTTGYDRTTTLTIGNSDGEFQEVTVRQTPLIDGQVPKNASGLAFAGQGVGCGIDYDYVLSLKSDKDAGQKFEPTKVKKSNNIFNIAMIEDLQKSGKLGENAYQETEIPLSTMTANMIDSSMVKNKKVDVNLTMGVNFGCINFSAHGHYVSTKKQTQSTVDYVITRFAPMYNVVLSPAEIRTYASDDFNNELGNSDLAAMEKVNKLIERYANMNKQRGLTGLNSNGLTDKQQAQIDAMNDRMAMNTTWGGVFSAAFTASYNKLYNALVTTKPDYTAADLALNQLDNDFGPFFIAGGDFGGSIIIHCHATDRMLDGTGKLSGSVTAGWGSNELSGSFSYTETGLDNFHEANPDFYIYGGNANETANGLWNIVMSTKLDERTKWTETLNKWVNSMYTTSDKKPIMSQAAPMSFVIEPIWTLFSDEAIQKYAQDYFIKKYEDRGIKGYLGIATGQVTNLTAEDLFNPDSEFWKKNKDLIIPYLTKASGNYNQAEDNK